MKIVDDGPVPYVVSVPCRGARLLIPSQLFRVGRSLPRIDRPGMCPVARPRTIDSWTVCKEMLPMKPAAFRLASFCVGALIVSACSSPLSGGRVCTDDFRYGLNVTVVDSVTNT